MARRAQPEQPEELAHLVRPVQQEPREHWELVVPPVQPVQRGLKVELLVRPGLLEERDQRDHKDHRGQQEAPVQPE